MKGNNNKGMSLIEILVVVAVFAVLGIITTRSVILTLQGSKKTESLIRVRENLNYSMGIIERNLRNADDISECPNLDDNILNYSDSDGNATSFSCVGVGTTDGYVASGSARLTNSTINITTCQFVCQLDSQSNPPSVRVVLEGVDKSTTGIQGADVSVVNQIYLRNY